MAKFYSFPHINQYTDMIKNVYSVTRFNGCDESGKPLFDTTRPLPTIKFTGTVKVHGTNAGIGYDPISKTVWAQSRNHVLSDKSDNCGFHTFVMLNKDIFITILSKFSSEYPVMAYGEWFGSGIQKHVAVEKLQRRLMIFAIKIVDDDRYPTWLSKREIELFFFPDNFIWNVYNFPVYEIEIDFENPKTSQNQLVELTNQVEKECPVGKYFGVNGIGEGIVWEVEKYGRFKVKGKEHSSSKVTNLASVDIEKLESIADFVEYAVTENRLNQGIEQVFTINNGAKPDIKKIRNFLTWITSDIAKEESETLKENNLIPEDVEKAVMTKARDWFIEYLKNMNSVLQDIL